MVTKDDIDALEERVTRMFPYIDVTAVNVIRHEIRFLRERIAVPCEACAKKQSKTNE